MPDMTIRDRNLAHSLFALDWLNFFVANVQTGFGPFIASYLASHKWTQGEIGLALSVGTVSAMLSQVPGGAAVDALRNKKVAAAWAIVAIIFSAVLLAISPTMLPVIAAEVFHGFASCMLTPAMAALALVLVGHHALGDRLGRNARWMSIGSAVAAGLMGLCGKYFSQHSALWQTKGYALSWLAGGRAVFWLTAALALPALVALAFIRPGAARQHEYGSAISANNNNDDDNNNNDDDDNDNDNDDRHDCNHEDDPHASGNGIPLSHADAIVTSQALESPAPQSVLSLLKDKRMLIFAACVLLFHLSNAAMLNLAAGEVTDSMSDNVQIIIALCIIVPQAIVALMSPWVGRTAGRWGRRPLLIAGFFALPVRALLFAFVSDPNMLVPVQIFDGVSAAVFGVMLPLIAADVAGNKGRYNLCIGLFGLAAGIGATLSTTAAGFIADHFGNSASFVSLAVTGMLAVLLVWLAMPETRDAVQEQDDERAVMPPALFQETLHIPETASAE
jgi:MFS family permease